MIKIENVSVAGFEAAVRGLRNPMNSWAKSDSHVGMSGDEWSIDPGYIIGPADKELMVKLAKGGSVHAKYRRQIVVWCDITAPTYFLKDLDTYKVGTVRNSTSTMHKLHSRDLTREDFSYEHLLEPSEDSLTAVTVDGEICHYSPIGMLDMTIKTLNHFRQKFVETGDKTYWWQMIQLLPMSYNYRSTFTFNYEVLAAIYRDRKDHKLDEWRDMCKWIKELPYSWIITGDVKEDAFPDEVTMVANDVEKDMNVEWKIEYTVPVYIEDIPFTDKWNEKGRTMSLYIDDVFVAWLYESKPYGTDWDGKKVVELTFLISKSLGLKLPSYDLMHY